VVTVLPDDACVTACDLHTNTEAVANTAERNIVAPCEQHHSNDKNVGYNGFMIIIRLLQFIVYLFFVAAFVGPCTVSFLQTVLR
jgi:hypothetical protein